MSAVSRIQAHCAATPEFVELLKRIPREDLTTIGMLWYLEKPDGSGRKD
jgi:hypothetical protein